MAVAIILKKSQYLRNRLTDFDEIWVCCVGRGPSLIPLWDWVLPSPIKFQDFLVLKRHHHFRVCPLIQ